MQDLISFMNINAGEFKSGHLCYGAAGASSDSALGPTLVLICIMTEKTMYQVKCVWKLCES